MAIEHDDGQTNMGQAMRAGQEQAQQRQEQAQAQAKPRHTWRGMRSTNLMSSKPRSKIVEQMTEKLREAYKNLGEEVSVSVIPMDKEVNQNLSISAIVVAVKFAEAENLLGYHTLILAGSIDPLTPRTENFVLPGGSQLPVEIPRYPYEKFNKFLLNAIKEELNKKFGRIEHISGECTVVPSDFNMDDAGLMNQLAANSLNTAAQILEENIPGYQPMDLTQITQDTKLILRPFFARQYDNDTLEDEVGNPIRADVQLKLVEQAPKEDTQDDPNEKTILTIAGFVDLVFNPAQEQAAAYGQPQRPTTRLYMPRVVITQMKAEDSLSTSMTVLGVALLGAFRDPQAWLQTFINNASPSAGPITRDPGYLNIESNTENDPSGYGTYVDTRTSTFTPAALGQYLSSVLNLEGIIVSQDIALGSPAAGRLQVIAEAANGDRDAMDYLYHTIDKLSGGIFSGLWNINDPIVYSDGEIAFNGYYEMGSGRRDVRDIDQLAQLCLQGSSNQKIGRAWSETYTALEIPAEVREQDRRNYISDVVQPTFTGKSVRVNWNHEALDAIVQAVSQAGLDVTQNAVFQSLSGQERHVARFSSGVAARPGYSKSFVSQGQRGGYQSPSGRGDYFQNRGFGRRYGA